jgi:hypothetical protein
MYFHVDPNSKLGKGILIAGIPLWGTLMWFQLDEFQRALESKGWPIAKGTIVSSRVETKTDVHGISHSTPKIEYRYVANGIRHDGDRIAFGIGRGELTWGYADRKVRAWPVGRVANVRYDPQQPKVSCLEPGGPGWDDATLFLLPAMGFILGLYTAFDVFGHKLRGRNRGSFVENSATAP